MEINKRYQIELKINGLPAMINAIGMRSHWIRRDNTILWKTAVISAMKNKLPNKPLKKARCKFTRCSFKEPDPDNLVISFKPICDGLVVAGVLVDDKRSVIGQPNYAWEYAPKHKGYIKIQVEEVHEESN